MPHRYPHTTFRSAVPTPGLPNRRCALALLALPLATGLAACAAGPGAAPAAHGDEREQLLARARAYWAAVQANDGVTAWRYEDVSLDPRWTLQAYLKRGGIVYESVEVKGLRSIDGDQAVLDVDVRFSVPQVRLRGQAATLADRWRRVDGQWYHVLRRHSLFEEPAR
jgi:hypothetical protein